MQYIHRKRIEKAIEMLSRRVPVKEVVVGVGYSDVSSFIKRFRKLVGMSPGEYSKVYSGR